MHQEYLDQLARCLRDTKVYDRQGTAVEGYEEAIECMVQLFSTVKQAKKNVFFIGNGGSAAIAIHMTADFMKNGGMRTVSLYNNSVMTCMANDYGYENVFSSPLELLAREGDLLVAISSSGNSPNIVNAVNTALKKGMQIITFSGFRRENRINSMGDYNVHVPVSHYGIVESIHNLILQQMVDTILERGGQCL